ELAAPYYVFKDARAQITLASPKGGRPPLDPKSQDPSFQTDITRRFEKDTDAEGQLNKTMRLKRPLYAPSNRRRACRLPQWSQRNASIAIAVSIGRVTMNRCPSSIICSRAFGMSRARIRLLTGGTRSDGGIVRPSAFCGS